MPMYEYYCDKCEREVQLTLSIRERDKGPIKCPKCGGKALRRGSQRYRLTSLPSASRRKIRSSGPPAWQASSPCPLAPTRSYWEEPLPFLRARRRTSAPRTERGQARFH